MKLVVFGLTISSSWGNGHATLWRGLQRALAVRGWRVTFFERNTSYYAQNRDLDELPEGELVIYDDWPEIESRARREVATADVAMVTSYCPDGIAASDLVLGGPHALRVFYDLDTPVTLERLRRGDPTSYIGPRGLADFDLVLSFTGGVALEGLASLAGAREVHPLYGHVDPQIHRPGMAAAAYRSDFSYIGTYAADRQAALNRLFIEPASRRPHLRFVLAGAQYPQGFPWTANIFFVRHLPPARHASFYASSRLTLNVTRSDMARMGWCPSGRLFEAAACGTAIFSDSWEGLASFFEPAREILTGASCGDVITALDLPAERLAWLGANARERVLAEHTSAHRARQFEDMIAASGSTRKQPRIGADSREATAEA